MVTDSFTDALGRLDPASRALLDLSLRRGMRPEEIGEMLGSEATSVVVAREQALQQLADELGLSDPSEIDGVRARLAELPAEAWTPGAATPGAAGAEPARPDPVEPDPEPAKPERRPEPMPDSAEPQQRKSRLPLLLLLLAVGVVALVVVLASGGNSSDEGETPTTAATTPKPSKPDKPAPAPRKVTMTPVAGAARDAEATAALAAGGKRLLIDVKGLPEPGSGSYQVWLYDSVVRAQSIGAARGTDLKLDLKLPPSANDYRSIDISREPRDGNANHSGESVLRVPLAKLSR